MKKFWVTGAKGFIGRHLAKKLCSSGHQVFGIGHGAWPELESKIWGISYWLNAEVNISGLTQLKAKHGEPDGIFHFAGGSSVGSAIANPFEDFNRTVSSTAELLEWIRQYSINTPLIAVSSAAVYGADYEGSISENANLSPYSPYGTNKLIMEELCRSYGKNFKLKITLPRLFSVYGPELKKQLLWDICNKLEDRNEIELGGRGSELRDWIHVKDVASILENLLLFSDTNAPVFNVATGQAISVNNVALALADAWSQNNPIKINFNGISRTGDPKNLIGDISKLKIQGFTPSVDFYKGVKEYVSWFKSLRSRV